MTDPDDLTPEELAEDPALTLRWSRQWSLLHRILAVNLLTLLVVAFSILWLESYRSQLRDQRVEQLMREAHAAAMAAAEVPAEERAALLSRMAGNDGPRYRLYGPNGNLLADSWAAGPATYRLRDPLSQAWTKDVARLLDRGFNALVGEPIPELFEEPAVDRGDAWPEVAEARALNAPASRVRDSEERTPVFSATAPAGENAILLATINDRSFTRAVRAQRTTLGYVMLGAALLTIFLSLFLARTIARPLRRIAVAAHRVRLGRARSVKVPRLPSRNDEIGMLARAVGDMSDSLRQRMDMIEAFAADVTHELKNPLASLRSAVDGLDRIDDPALKRQLLDVVRQDVVRLDRLIGDISEAARTDAQLARTQFEKVDLGTLIEQMVEAWEQRSEASNVRIAFARPRRDTTIVAGDESRLARAIDNLIDNAISFSPPGGLVEISAVRSGDRIRIQVKDEGPGVPHDQREAIFKRFHSERPSGEDFGRHSGLGLAIASAIVEGHDGTIMVHDCDKSSKGACFTISLPAWGAQ